VGYTPTKNTVKIPRPQGRTEGSTKSTNAPTQTQAHIAVAGKNRVSTPSDTSGARGGHAVGTASKTQRKYS
jgi:hypothetical protein